MQILRHVILPNALPEIFTGLRTSMGVCWGTVVAAELVAADKGVGSMIMIAKNFLQTDTVVIGIIIIGLIGYAIEMLMRLLERRLIPWKGSGDFSGMEQDTALVYQSGVKKLNNDGEGADGAGAGPGENNDQDDPKVTSINSRPE